MGARDREKYNAYMNEYMKRRFHERRGKVIAHLGGKCVSCGSVDRLELDHIDPGTKAIETKKLWGSSEALFWAEVAKCQLLCRPCHCLKSTIERGQTPSAGTHGTLTSYRHCKCDLCRAAKSAYSKKYAQKRKEARAAAKRRSQSVAAECAVASSGQ